MDFYLSSGLNMVCLEKKQRWNTVKKTISILLLLTLFLPAAACGQVDALQAQYERNRAQSHREDVLREQRNDQGLSLIHI